MRPGAIVYVRLYFTSTAAATYSITLGVNLSRVQTSSFHSLTQYCDREASTTQHPLASLYFLLLINSGAYSLEATGYGILVSVRLYLNSY